jgi:GAF domain-containing protein
METKLRALYDLGQKLILLRDARQIAANVLRIAARVIDLHDSDFFLVDEGRRELYTIARRGCLHSAGDVRLPLGGDKGITVVAAQSRQPIYVPDVRQDPRYVHTGFSAVSELAVPVQTEDRVLGVINVESEQLDAFSEVDQELLAILANQAALALNNARLHVEERRWAEQMIALNELSRRIGASLDLQATLEAIATAAYELIPCALAEISLWDAGTERLALRALRGEPRPVRPLGASYPPGPGYTGWLVRYKQPLLVPDVDARQDIRPSLLSGRLPYRAYVGVPLLLGQELIGILALIANEAGAFNDAHAELLTALAAQAAVAIRNARFYEEVTRRHRELAALYAVASAINQPLPLPEVLDQAITKVIEVMEAEAGVIRLLDEEAGELAIASCQGFSPAYIRQVDRIRLGEGIVGRVAQSGEPLVVQDLANDPRSAATQAIAAEGFHTLAVVPLKVKQEIVGTLGLVTRRSRDFGATVLDLLTAIGQQIGVAVENARLYADLSRRARELEAVHAVAAAVNRPGDLRQALEEGLKQALAVTGLEMGAIAVTDRQCETLALEYHQGVCTACDWLKELLKKKPLEAWPEGKDLDIEEIPAGHPEVPAPVRERKIRLSADVPLFAEGNLVGILSVASRRVRSFTPEERSLLQAIGHQLGTAIANAQLRQEALAAERMAAVGRVATSVAHDLRSPLGGIQRSAEFLARPEISPGTRQRLSEATASLARRLIITTQEILDYVRGGKLPLRRDLASLPEFLNGVLAVLEVDFSDQGIEVVRDCGYTGAVVMDTDRMAQVVYNIAANARDAMPRGGTFEVATRKTGERVELRFTDTGPGVPQELSDRIFEPFFTYGKREGAGLGLAIARRIVEEHDGELWMESSDGTGAAFVVSLPA